MSKEFYGIKEFAAKTGLSQDTIRRDIKSGKIPATQLAGKNGRWIISSGELDKITKEIITEDYHIDHRLQLHFDKLAEVANTVYETQKYILSYEPTEHFTISTHPGEEDFLTFYPPPHQPPILSSFAHNSVEIQYPDVVYLLQHLLQGFPDLQAKEWQSLVRQALPPEIMEALRLLGNTGRFNYCPNCQVCKDILG